MLAISKGYENGVPNYTGFCNISTCSHHFHPSVIQCDENGSCTLKTGASPTLHLTRFAMENENSKEEKSLSRTVGSTEDMQYVYDYEIDDVKKFLTRTYHQL